MKILTLIWNHSKTFSLTWIRSKRSNCPFEVSWCGPYKRNLCSTNLLQKFSIEHKAENVDIAEKRCELEKWLEIQKLSGKYVPESISEEKYELLLTAKSVRQRHNILEHHYRIEKHIKRDAIYKVTLKKMREERYAAEASKYIKYGIWKNSMFSKAFKPTRINLYSHRLASAVLHGQPLIIDLAFEEHMNLIEKKLLWREVRSSINLNMKRREPFNLMICNAQPEDVVLQNIQKLLPKKFPMVISPKSYLDLFTKEKLIYLTKDATAEMVEFDCEAIYIIGGLVDHGKKYPLTFEKAKYEGIQTQKLPLASLSASPFITDITLNIPDVIKILLEVHETGSWKNAFRKLPHWQVHRANRNFGPKLGIDEGLILLESIR